MYNYFKDAQRIAKEIKSSFSNDPEKLAELRRIEQVAEHNGIALNVISRVGALDPSLKVTFEFTHHPCFATAVVKRSWIFLFMISTNFETLHRFSGIPSKSSVEYCNFTIYSIRVLNYLFHIYCNNKNYKRNQSTIICKCSVFVLFLFFL